MFIDEAKIYVKAGGGGDGCRSFRREKHVPRGGPDGGDGGDGGDVILVINSQLNTLIDFKYRQHYKSERGRHGQGANKHGKNGQDCIIHVPLGTIARDGETGEIIADLSEIDDRIIAAHSGRGGRGNARFVSATNQAPTRADSGLPGEERTILLELKLLADIGLVGFPNAGKSTLLSRVSSAHPKIADYPFTTLQPNLGIVRYGEFKSFVMADIPGIIEGAHDGKGLGLQFLRHIERTKVLLFLIDSQDEDPVAEYRKLLEELRLYSDTLAKKTRFVTITKTDLMLPDEPRVLPDFGKDIEAFAISAVNGDGLRELVFRLGRAVETMQA